SDPATALRRLGAVSGERLQRALDRLADQLVGIAPLAARALFDAAQERRRQPDADRLEDPRRRYGGRSRFGRALGRRAAVGLAEVRSANELLVSRELARVSLVVDLALLEHVGTAGNRERLADELPDEHHRHAA